MQPAAEQLRQRLADVAINVPAIPVLHNRRCRQLRRCGADPRCAGAPIATARYAGWKLVQAIAARSVHQIKRMRPGQVLAGLGKAYYHRCQNRCAGRYFALAQLKPIWKERQHERKELRW